MPIYKYNCTKCNKIFEVDIPIREVPLKQCPKCNNKNCLNRVWEKPIDYVAKCSGFYGKKSN